MKNSSKRVIIDTNLWISFLISKNYTQLDKVLFSKNCILIFSEELLNEFLTVIQRPKFRRFFTSEDTEYLMDVIQEYAEFTYVKSDIKICRDVKDNFLLSLAKDAKADFLITGDNDLLQIETFNNTTIINLTEFLKLR